MVEEAKHPFCGYRVYSLPPAEKDGRISVALVKVGDRNNRITMSKARYLMSVYLGRILESDEHVDHIDNDCTNDTINNFQLLTLAENNAKAARIMGRKWARLKCPYCNKVFEKPLNQTFLAKGGAFTACSRKCSGKIRNRMQHFGIDKDLQKVLNENIIKEFRKHGSE